MYSYPKIPHRMVSYQFVSAKSEKAGEILTSREILRTRITRGALKFVVFPAGPCPPSLARRVYLAIILIFAEIS